MGQNLASRPGQRAGKGLVVRIRTASFVILNQCSYFPSGSCSRAGQSRPSVWVTASAQLTELVQRALDELEGQSDQEVSARAVPEDPRRDRR